MIQKKEILQFVKTWIKQEEISLSEKARQTITV